MSAKVLKSPALLIQAEVTIIGKDLLIALTGGDTAYYYYLMGKDAISDTTRFPAITDAYKHMTCSAKIFLKQTNSSSLGTPAIIAEFSKASDY